MTLRALIDGAGSRHSLFGTTRTTVDTTSIERRRRRFVNVLLRTDGGATVRFYDDLLKNRTVLINFMYTQCTERCPLTTAKLREVQGLLGDRLAREVFIYSITVDPVHDRPAVLQHYARMARAKTGWRFLTGSSNDIRQLRANFGDDPNLPFERSNHLNLIVYGVESMERWGAFPVWTEPATMLRYLSWIEPARARLRC